MANLSDALLIDRFDLVRRLAQHRIDRMDYGEKEHEVLDEVIKIINQMCLEGCAGQDMFAERGED